MRLDTSTGKQAPPPRPRPKVHERPSPRPMPKQHPAAQVERPAPARRNVPSAQLATPHLRPAGRHLTSRQQRLQDRFGADYKAQTGTDLKRQPGLMRALIAQGYDPQEVFHTASLFDARPDRREPAAPPPPLPDLFKPLGPGSRLDHPPTVDLQPLHHAQPSIGGRGQYHGGGSGHNLLSTLNDLLATGSTTDTPTTDAQRAAQIQATANAMDPSIRDAAARDAAREIAQGGTLDPLAEQVIGSLGLGLGATAAKVAGERLAARATGDLLGGGAAPVRVAEATGGKGVPLAGRYEPVAPKPFEYRVPTRGPLKRLAATRPSPAKAVSSFAGRSAAHRVAAGGAILASAPVAREISQLGHQAGTAIRGGAPKISVDPSRLNPVGQALAAGKQPAKAEKAKSDLQHGPGRLGLSPELRHQLMVQALANGWQLPSDVGDFELVAKAYKRAGNTLQHLAAGLVENAGDYAFVPAAAGALYDATQRSLAGEGTHPFVQFGQQAADSTVNALEHPIDNPLFALAGYGGIVRGVGRASAIPLRVKPQPLGFRYAEDVHGVPHVHPYGVAAPNTLTRPFALAGQALLNSPLAKIPYGRVPKGATKGLTLQEHIMARQASHLGQADAVRTTAAGNLHVEHLARTLKKMSPAEQTAMIHAFMTGSPPAHQVAFYANEIAKLERAKSGYTTKTGKQVPPRSVDEVALQALREKHAVWQDLVKVEEGMSPDQQDAFGAEGQRVEAINQEHLRNAGITQEQLDQRLQQRQLQQHPTLPSTLQEINREERQSHAARLAEARRLTRESETRAAGLFRNAAKWDRQANALKGVPRGPKPATKLPTNPVAPTHPKLDEIAAQARANAGKHEGSNGDYFMTKDGELGVVSGTILPGAKGGMYGKTQLQVKIVRANGKIATQRITGRELAAGKNRYRARTAAPAAAQRLGRGEKRPLAFQQGDLAHADQEATVYALQHNGPIPVGVAKITEQPGMHGGEGSRRGFNERWRVVLGHNHTLPKNFATRGEAAAWGARVDAALSHGMSPQDAVKHANSGAELGPAPAVEAPAPKRTSRLDKLPPAERKVALKQRAQEAHDLATRVQEAGNQHAKRLQELRKNRSSVVEERAAPRRAAAIAQAQAEMAAEGYEPRMYVPETAAEGASTAPVFGVPDHAFNTSALDRLGARARTNTGTTLRKGLVDESTHRFLAAAARPTQVAHAIAAAQRTLDRVGHELHVGDIGHSMDKRFIYIATNKAGRLDPISTTKRLEEMAQADAEKGLGNAEVQANMVERVFSPVTPEGNVLPPGTYYAVPKVVHDRLVADARTEVQRRNLAPGLRSVQQKVTKGMISTRPATILNNAGGVAMSALGGTLPQDFARYMHDPRARELIRQAAPEMVHRGIIGSQTHAGTGGKAVTAPARWWMDKMRGGSVAAEDAVRGAQLLHDLFKQAKQVQYGNKFLAAMHRVDAETYQIAHGLREQHPERYAAAIKHTTDFVGDFGKLHKLDPFLSLAAPFWRWTTHIVKSTLKTMPLHYPGRAVLLMALGEVGREYQREHGIWPSWMQGALDAGDHIPGFKQTKGIRQAINTSGFWPYATQSQALAPGFDNVGIEPRQLLSNATPLAPLAAAALLREDLATGSKITDPNKHPVDWLSGDYFRAVGNRLLQTVPTPYSFAGQEPTSLGPISPRYKDNGLPRRENSPFAIATRFLGLPVSPVVTSGPKLQKLGAKAESRAQKDFNTLPRATKLAMHRSWQRTADHYVGVVSVP